MYCINCGKEITGNYKFCINCGNEIKNLQETKVEKKETIKKNQDNKEQEIIYKEEQIKSIVDNNIVVPLVFGILLATILSIVCISSFNKETNNALKYTICKIDKYSL